MITISDKLKDLFERPIVCALATVMPSGQPQVTPVWWMYDGTYVIINSKRGRQKDRNMVRDAKVTILVIDPKDSGHWIELRGHILDITEEGANDVIDKLSMRYEGHKFRSLESGEVRVTYKIEVDKLNGE